MKSPLNHYVIVTWMLGRLWQVAGAEAQEAFNIFGEGLGLLLVANHFGSQIWGMFKSQEAIVIWD